MKHTFDYGIVKKRKKGDFILLAAVLLLAGSFYGFLKWRETDGVWAVVTVDGKEQRREKISGGSSFSFTVAGEGGSNTVTIDQGQVFVSEADCPDKRCVLQGKISKTGESIICLPHKLVVTVEGGQEGELDAVTN